MSRASPFISAPGLLAAGLHRGLAVCLCMPRWTSENARRSLRKDLLPYAYIGPHLIFFVIFFITPAVYGVYAAFTKWDLFNEPVFIGLDNFRTMLLDSGNTYYKQLRNGLWNTIKFVLYSVPFCIAVPLTLAVALNTKCRGNKFFQALYYFPSLLSITTVTLSWRYMFSPGLRRGEQIPGLHGQLVHTALFLDCHCGSHGLVVYRQQYGHLPERAGLHPHGSLRGRRGGRRGPLAEVFAHYVAGHALSADVHLCHHGHGAVQHLRTAAHAHRLCQQGSQRGAADVHSGKRRQEAGGRHVRRHGADAGPVHHGRFLLPAATDACQRTGIRRGAQETWSPEKRKTDRAHIHDRSGHHLDCAHPMAGAQLL